MAHHPKHQPSLLEVKQAQDIRNLERQSAVQTSALLYLADAKAREEKAARDAQFAAWWASLTRAEQVAYNEEQDRLRAEEARQRAASRADGILATILLAALGVTFLAFSAHIVLGFATLALFIGAGYARVRQTKAKAARAAQPALGVTDPRRNPKPAQPGQYTIVKK